MTAADWIAGTCDVCGCDALVLVESNAFVSWTSCAACIDREPAAARAPASAPQERMFEHAPSMRGQLGLDT